MELKRILARDSRSANEKAIKLYGREVMIVSSQRVDNQIELVVAVESPQSPEVPSAETAGAAVVTSEVPTKAFGKFFHQAQLNPLDESDVMAQLPAKGLSEDQQSQAERTYEAHRGAEIVALLRDEIANLREDLLLTMRTRLTVQAGGLTPDVQLLSQALAEAGMPASMRLLFESELVGVATLEEAKVLIQKTLLKTMKRKPGSIPSTGRHALIGPSGSGKTLMTARLAHLAALSHGAHKQAVISFNDGRPGAWAQLQLLASQIGVDCYRAQDLDALKVILDDLGSGRSVWVDTAGTQFMNNMQDLKAAGLAIHAVIPLDVTATHAQRVLNSKDPGWASVMLTKADESIPSWALLKCLGETQTVLTCISDTANVKSGVLPYDPRTLIDQALGAVCVQSSAPRVAVNKQKVQRSTKAQKAPVRKRQSVAVTKAVHG